MAVIYGTAGDDTKNGTSGQDTIYGWAAGGNANSPSGKDKLYGEAGSDILYGGTEDDYLDSGVGIDTLYGGSGNDIYIVDGIGTFFFDAAYSVDTVTEYFNKGIDTVNSSVSFSLSDNLENLTLTGSNGILGTGNALDNIIYGGAADNYYAEDELIYPWNSQGLDGGEGNDKLYGEAGKDGLDGRAGNDTLDGGTGDDYLDGDEGNDILTGGSGDDYLSGYNFLSGEDGTNTLIGGTGDDIYTASSTDKIIEYFDEGIDTVLSTSNYTLGDNLEELQLWFEEGAVVGTGNALDNKIYGNEDNNFLYGAEGDDDLTGYIVLYDKSESGYSDASDDYLDGGAGNDTLDGGYGEDSLYGGAGDDSLYSSDVSLDNDGGNEILDGGDGDDDLDGGDGNETLTGGDGDDNLDGDDSNDTLTGGNGDDYLDAGYDSDTLTGGMGADNFDFYSEDLGGFDTITDFVIADDTITVSADGFGGGLTAGAAITDAQFKLGSAAGDASDRFIYNQNTGALIFDKDGTGTNYDQVRFAQLPTGLAMTNADIYVVY